jgi:hypothetical protein
MAFFDAIFGRCNEGDGEIVLVSPGRNSIVEMNPVGRGDDLCRTARVAHCFPGCYFKAQVMDGAAIEDRIARERKPCVGGRAEVKTIVSLTLDVDAGKSSKYPSRKHAIWALENMPHKPSLIVNSGGSDGGFHATWLLREPHRIDGDRDHVQKICHRWCEKLKELMGGRLDKTSNIDRVLRVPGVPRKDGKHVDLFRYDAERLYALEDFIVT